MLKIAHIVHPVVVHPESDLVIAQPITFETMKIARDFALQTYPGSSNQALDVRLFAVQYEDEERLPLPSCFIRTPALQRSIKDIKAFKKERKLALIKDIYDILYDATAGSDTDYLVYTNVDIALMPYFYTAVAAIIKQGCDAFVINRRTISNRYSTPGEIPLMAAEVGEKHQGWDCFISRRDFYPDFDLGDACIGTGWIGRVIMTNMASLAKKFEVFEDLHMTFHIGNDKAWKTDEYMDYLEHNKNECQRILVNFDEKYGPFDRTSIPGRFFMLLERSLTG